MKYIYDIVLNFHEDYYEFYEWKRKDKIKNIDKIPAYRVLDKDILILKNNKVRIDNKFLSQIKNDNNKNHKLICLVSNTKISLGLQFDKDGNLIKKSSLIYEEEDEVNDFCKDIEITKIKYLEIKKQLQTNNLRLEKEKKDIISKYIEKTTDIKTLKYLYYDFYKEECNDILKIKKNLKQEINKDWTQQQNNLYSTVKLLSKKH